MIEAQPDRPVLIVDDEVEIALTLATLLRSNGIRHVLTCGDASEVEERIEKSRPDVILLDLNMPGVSGLEVLVKLHEQWPEIAVIVVTASDDVDTAVRCMMAGSSDYMVKPVEESRLVSGVRNALEIRRLKREFGELRSRLLTDTLRSPEAFAGILTADRVMQSVFLFIESIASTGEPVLITGETGVGKDLIAQAIHSASGRTGSFVAVNIAGLDDSMISDTLFGHRKGAFTGALESRDGLIQRAAGGSLFLDEIGDLSAQSQTRVLRILDTGEYYPVGSDVAKRSDARMIFATNRDIEALSKDDSFRRDLYYRLSTYALRIPPLRDRPNDIPILLEHFFEEAAGELSISVPQVPRELHLLFANYDLPGNVRELRSIVFEMLSRHTSGPISLDFVKEKLGFSRGADAQSVRGIAGATVTPYASTSADSESPGPSYPTRLPTIKQATESLIEEALSRSEGNQSMAAGMLGISHQALNKRLRHRDQFSGRT